MNRLSIVEASDIAYKQVFANQEERPWGFLYWNEENPLHYDANHAHLSKTMTSVEEAEAFVQEIVSFFEGKGIFPRIYLYRHDDQEILLEVLQNHGFRTELLPSPIQLWQGELAQTEHVPGLVIEPVTAANYEDCLLVESVPELGGRAIREKAFALEFSHPAFQHFLLRLDGDPASSLCLLHTGDVVRIENVVTLPAYRGRGLIGHLIRHAQEVFLASGGAELWVCPINERVEKVYSRYGFVTMGEIPFLHAFRGGKGVLEIR